MIKFIKRTFLFIGILLGYFFLNFLINILVILYSLPKEAGIHYNYFLLGDSHIQGGIDPQMLFNAKGYTRSGEPYFITYWKLKYLIDNRVLADTIILGFGHHNVSGMYDEALLSRSASKNFKRSYAFHIYSSKDSVSIDYYKYFNVLFRECALIPQRNHFKYEGHFGKIDYRLPERRFYKDSINHYHHFFNRFNRNIMYDVSISNINYLDSIVNLCQKMNIKLILVGTPVSQRYISIIPNKFSRTYNKLKKKYNTLGVKIIDDTHMLLSDTLFADFDHLNYQGAKDFMKIFKEQIK